MVYICIILRLCLYRGANSSSTPSRLSCTHMLNETIVVLYSIHFILMKQMERELLCSQCMDKLSSVHPRPKETREILPGLAQ